MNNTWSTLKFYRWIFLVLALLPVIERYFFQLYVFEYHFFFILSGIGLLFLFLYLKNNTLNKNNALTTILLITIYSLYIFDWNYDNSNEFLSTNNLSVIIFLAVMSFVFFTRPTGQSLNMRSDSERDNKQE